MNKKQTKIILNKDKNILKDYTKDKFLQDLQKACRPVKKSDKQKPSSGKT